MFSERTQQFALVNLLHHVFRKNTTVCISVMYCTMFSERTQQFALVNVLHNVFRKNTTVCIC